MTKTWPHAPIHLLSGRGAYMVTAGTCKKELLFGKGHKLTMLLDLIMESAEKYGWELQAWAVMGNHYHFVGVSQNEPETLRDFVSDVHRISATKLNEMDGTAGRRVWYQFWDSQITYQKSYLARLRYVHLNPEHHGIVQRASDYEWCSAAWFEREADNAFRKTVMSFGASRIQVLDDY